MSEWVVVCFHRDGLTLVELAESESLALKYIAEMEYIHPSRVYFTKEVDGKWEKVTITNSIITLSPE